MFHTRLNTFLVAVNIIFVVTIVSVTIFVSQNLRIQAQTSCMTREQVSADSRCLYIYSNKVYEKGSRSKPHQKNPCGTDVTSIIKDFHYLSPAKYLDPNFVANVCAAGAPTATPTRPATPPTVTPTTASSQPTVTPTIPSGTCPLKVNGDANCNNTIDLVDFEIWRKEDMNILTTKTADFNHDNTVNLADFEIWRTAALNR